MTEVAGRKVDMTKVEGMKVGMNKIGRMRYVAAYLLAGLGGNEKPSVQDIETILGSVGIESDKDRLAQVMKELEGKNIEEVISAGKEKLATMGSSVNVTQVTTEAVAAEAPEVKDPDNKEKEETEESDDDLGFGLFD